MYIWFAIWIGYLLNITYWFKHKLKCINALVGNDVGVCVCVYESESAQKQSDTECIIQLAIGLSHIVVGPDGIGIAGNK